MLYMVTFTINIPQMLAYIYHTWILWDIKPYQANLLAPKAAFRVANAMPSAERHFLARDFVGYPSVP